MRLLLSRSKISCSMWDIGNNWVYAIFVVGNRFVIEAASVSGVNQPRMERWYYFGHGDLVVGSELDTQWRWGTCASNWADCGVGVGGRAVPGPRPPSPWAAANVNQARANGRFGHAVSGLPIQLTQWPAALDGQRPRVSRTNSSNASSLATQIFFRNVFSKGFLGFKSFDFFLIQMVYL